MRYEGFSSAIELSDTALTITREGMLAKGALGRTGPRTIPLSGVAAVRMTPAGKLKNGFLQVLLAGEENAPSIGTTVAATNPNCVVFAAKGNEAFAGLFSWLQGVAATNRTQGLLTSHPELLEAHVSGKDRFGAALSTAPQAFATSNLPALPSFSAPTGYKAAVAQNLSRETGLSTQGAILSLQSHDAGRNALVALFSDRIERAKPRSFGAFSGANQDVEMTPIRAISSVQAKKDGFRTLVIVYASGNNIEFRFSHDDAARFKNELQRLMLQGPAPAAPAPAPAIAPVVDVADQLAKFAALKQQGVLTEDEFAAQKARLLGL